MKLLFLFLFTCSLNVFSQESSKCCTSNHATKHSKDWSLGTSLGYINITKPSLGNNIWGSVNLSYSKKRWNITLWAGSNIWIEGKQPDLRVGVSTNYTVLKW